MNNPFIFLTDLHQNTIRINIGHIMTYDSRKFKDSDETYTYVLLAGGNALSREVKETPEVIDQMIAEYYNGQSTKTQRNYMVQKREQNGSYKTV